MILENYNIFEYYIEHERTFLKLKGSQENLSEVYALSTPIKTQMRLKLIRLVEEEKLSTAEAGRIVGIKQTSACRIINSYKKYNRIF